MWDSLIINPMLNLLLTLYGWVGNNFILAIAIFTVFFRLLMLPFTLKQQRSSMKMQEMQPQVQAIQKKYKDNPVKMQEEFKTIGYNPAEQIMGCLPMLLQFPIWIGLYRAIIMMVADSPQLLYELTQRVYDGVDLNALLPINNNFLWMNLAQPDPRFVLPVLVALTMFISQKLMMPNTQTKPGEEENPMASATKSMTYTMPLMFGVFSLQFAAGLSVYFVISNLIGILQGFIIRREREQAKVELELEKKNKKPYEIESEAEVVDEFEASQTKAKKAYKESTNNLNGKTKSKNGSSNKKGSSKKKSKRKQKGKR